MTDQLKYACCTALLLCALGWAACTQQRQPCLTPRIASLILQTVHYTTDTATTTNDTAIPAAGFTALPPSDTLRGFIYPTQSQFTLSLSPDTSSCRWTFTTDSTKYAGIYGTDTLTFFYRRNLQFLSNACGYTYFYTLDSVHTTHTIIDSLHILNTGVTNNVNTKHIQIYIHPDY